MRPACLFNIATVSSRLSRSLYSYSRHPLSLRSPAASLIHRARCASMFNMSLFYLPSQLNAIVPYVHVLAMVQFSRSFPDLLSIARRSLLQSGFIVQLIIYFLKCSFSQMQPNILYD